MDYNMIFVLAAGVLALLFSVWKTQWIEAQDQGTEKMKVIGSSIAEGAMAFLKAEYRVLTVFVIAVAILLGIANSNREDSSILISLSFENPPASINIFFFIYSTNIISKLSLTPVEAKTFSLTKFISFFISLQLALFLFMKKLQCFSEIAASPNLISSGTDDLMSSQTFLFVCSKGFLKVLPPVLIFVG